MIKFKIISFLLQEISTQKENRLANITESNLNSITNKNSTSASTEKTMNKLTSNLGIDSVKSLRERLDKKLKAISETIDSISQKESMRGFSSNREKDRLEFGSVEKKKNILSSNNITNNIDINTPKNNDVYDLNKKSNRFEDENNYSNSNLNKNNFSDIRVNLFQNKIECFVDIDNFDKNNIKSKENFRKHHDSNNTNENNYDGFKHHLNTGSDINSNNYIKKYDKENDIVNETKRKISENKNTFISNNNNSNLINTEPNNLQSFKMPQTNNNIQLSLDKKIFSYIDPSKTNNKLTPTINCNILINDNINVDKAQYFSNQDELNNNANFLINSSSSAGIVMSNQNYNKNLTIEENFMNNDLRYKNFINNEISKISHDNFNDEGDPISDNEVENFYIKKKKYNNIAIQDGIFENNIDKKTSNTNEFIHQKNEDFILNNNKQSNSNVKSNNLQVKEELNSIGSNAKILFDKNSDDIREKIINYTDFENEEKNAEFGSNKVINTELHLKNFNLSKNEKTSKEKNYLNLRNSSLNNKFNLNSTKDEISMLHNVNNSLEKIEPSIRVQEDNLLQKIEEINKEKYQETLKNQEVLEKIEANLSLMQRLTHEKWQIRKNAFKQIAELINTLQSNKSLSENENVDISETMETLFPWFKYLITDTNVVALNEGLNSFCFLLDYCNNEQKNKALILFFDELEKLIMHNKNSIFDLCLKVIMNVVINTKKFATFTISEIIRKLNTTNNKLLIFINRIIEEILENPGTISEHYLKLLFEKTAFYYNNSKQINKNIERKKIYGKIISTIFEKINDDLETIKHHLNLNLEDASNLEKLLSKVNKEKKEISEINSNTKNKLKYTLYEAIPENKVQHSNNNLNTYNSNKHKGIENNSNFNSATQSTKNYSGGINNNLSSKINNEFKNYGSNGNINNHIISEVYDLYNILSDEFFEIPYITALKTKKDILENVNRKLLDYSNIKDREYKEILNIINLTIDDTNVLVNLEGIKFLKHFCRLNKHASNQNKLKNLVISCYEKFKDKKTNVKIELFDLFDTIIVNQIFPFEQFFVMKLQHVISHKNPIVKQNILEYIKEVFSKCDKVAKNINNQNNIINNKNNENVGYSKSHLNTEGSLTKRRNKSRDFKSDLNFGKISIFLIILKSSINIKCLKQI